MITDGERSRRLGGIRRRTLSPVKQIADAALRKVGLEIKRIPLRVSDPEREYVRGGRIPWSRGYREAKERFIRRILADSASLSLFETGANLPEQFGTGFDERCVEYPWLLSHLQPGPERMLDAGSALNHAFIVDHPVFQQKKLHILTLAPEKACFWQKGISYLYDDLRNIPVRDDYYDTISCVSTLEHVGCDNMIYTQDEAHRENRSEDFVLVMRELRRTLRPGGTLLLTVPFGIYHNFSTFQQFDRQLLSRARDAFGRTSEEAETFYRYTVNGWNLATMTDCATSEYVDWVAAAWAHNEWPNPLPVESDMAAAARSVACVRLTKA